jgi:hypothetical protein
MTSTKIILIHDANGKLLRYILPDSDDEVQLHAENIIEGETAVIGARADYHAIGPYEMLKRHLS